MTVAHGAPKDCPATPEANPCRTTAQSALRGRRCFRLLHGQPTLNECGDDGIVVPIPEPETCGAAVRPGNKDVLTIGLDRDDVMELRVPLGPSGQDGNELHSILSD